MMDGNTPRFDMAKAKIAITLDRTVLSQLDQLVEEKRFANRSQAVEAAVVETLQQVKRSRLIDALKDVDPLEEAAFAEAGIEAAIEIWPEY